MISFGRIFSWGLVVTIALGVGQWPVEARAHSDRVAAAMADLRYELTVSWDQVDVAYRDEAVTRFLAEVDRARSEGASDAELVTSLSDAAFDHQTAKDLEMIANAAKGHAYSSDSVIKMASDIAMANQKSGENWSAGARGAVVGAVIIAAVVITLVCLSESHGQASASMPAANQSEAVSTSVPGLMGPRMSSNGSQASAGTSVSALLRSGLMGPRMSGN